MRYDLLRILLVDDNQHMRVLLAEILRAIGVKRILVANDGAQGLTMMRHHDIDIVMTDLSMQPLDGIDFVRLLRNSPDSPNQFVPVVMITGHSTMSRVAEARDAGVNEFLAKPLTARAVIERIHQELSTVRNITAPPMREVQPTDQPKPLRGNVAPAPRCCRPCRRGSGRRRPVPS